MPHVSAIVYYTYWGSGEMRGAASRGIRVKSTTSQRYLLKRWASVAMSLRDKTRAAGSLSVNSIGC